MKRFAPICILGAVVAGSAAAALPAPVTLDGVGGVVPGMSVRATARAWGVRLRPTEVTRGCATANVRKGTLQGYALFENGRFGAVFFQHGARTPSGIHVGSTMHELKETYKGRLKFERHAYQRGAWYAFLTRRSRPHWRIRFDISAKGRVMQIAFGARAVAYIEGCA